MAISYGVKHPDEPVQVRLHDLTLVVCVGQRTNEGTEGPWKGPSALHDNKLRQRKPWLRMLRTHTHTPDTRSKPVVKRSLFLGLLYLLGIFKVPQNAIRVDIRGIFSGYSLKPERLTMNCIDSG